MHRAPITKRAVQVSGYYFWVKCETKSRPTPEIREPSLSANVLSEYGEQQVQYQMFH
jgi:hypothetical protein